jgi:hypothetical protein
MIGLNRDFAEIGDDRNANRIKFALRFVGKFCDRQVMVPINDFKKQVYG